MLKTIDEIRNDFPVLKRKVNGNDLIYLDNAATSQKPFPVIKAISDYYSVYNSNIHRGVHHLSQLATNKYEQARVVLKEFINAKNIDEVIFTKGTTDAINIIASSWGRKYLHKGDEILITEMEHHGNIVPWQMICEEKEAVLKVAPINEDGELIVEEFEKLISENTKLVSIVHISNSLGTINPIKELIDIAHRNGSVVAIDSAQSVPHYKVDVQALNCDFMAFSGHKMYGPTGVGVLYAKKRFLDEMLPYQGGGNMIKEVTFKKTTYNDPPDKFEAGTPNIAGVIALAEAVKYIHEIGYEFIQEQETSLLNRVTNSFKEIPGVRIVGTAKQKASVISFLIDKTHPFDIGTLLDQLGIAIRTGHHCTQPIMEIFNISGTARASFSFYNTEKEVDIFISAIKKAVKMLT